MNNEIFFFFLSNMEHVTFLYLAVHIQSRIIISADEFLI